VGTVPTALGQGGLNRRHGLLGSFTLIEVLVVVAIIGILAAMLTPSISGLRERGRSARCKSNLRNLSAAALNYAYSHGSTFPAKNTYWDSVDDPEHPWRLRIGWIDWQPGYDNPNNGEDRGDPDGLPPLWWGDSARWSITNTGPSVAAGETDYTSGSLWPYAGGNIKIYLCPTFAKKCGNEMPAAMPDAPKKYDPVRSYVMGPEASEEELQDITDASKRLLFADIDLASMTSADGGGDGWSWDGKFDVSDGELVGAFHSGKGNAVFMDGHVEQLLPGDVTNACSGDW